MCVPRAYSSRSSAGEVLRAVAHVTFSNVAWRRNGHVPSLGWVAGRQHRRCKRRCAMSIKPLESRRHRSASLRPRLPLHWWLACRGGFSPTHAPGTPFGVNMLGLGTLMGDEIEHFFVHARHRHRKRPAIGEIGHAPALLIAPERANHAGDSANAACRDVRSRSARTPTSSLACR